MYVRLNVATKPLLSHRRFLTGSALLALVAGLLFLIFGWRFYTIRNADAQLRRANAAFQQEMDRVMQQREDLNRFFSERQNAGLQERAQFIKSVIEARSFNWTQMFMDLERTLPPGVHVVRIEPKLDKGGAAVKFIVGASTEEAEFRLVKAFEDSKSFSQVELISKRAAAPSAQQGADPLLLEFTAVYAGT